MADYSLDDYVKAKQGKPGGFQQKNFGFKKKNVSIKGRLGQIPARGIVSKNFATKGGIVTKSFAAKGQQFDARQKLSTKKDVRQLLTAKRRQNSAPGKEIRVQVSNKIDVRDRINAKRASQMGPKQQVTVTGLGKVNPRDFHTSGGVTPSHNLRKTIKNFPPKRNFNQHPQQSHQPQGLTRTISNPNRPPMYQRPQPAQHRQPIRSAPPMYEQQPQPPPPPQPVYMHQPYPDPVEQYGQFEYEEAPTGRHPLDRSYDYEEPIMEHPPQSLMQHYATEPVIYTPSPQPTPPPRRQAIPTVTGLRKNVQRPVQSGVSPVVKNVMDADSFSPLQGYRVLITNLHGVVTQDDIVELFGSLGALKKARVIKNGVAEVIYVERHCALAAVKKYHMRELDGRPMQVNMTTKATPKEQKVMVPPVRASTSHISKESSIDTNLLHRALFRTQPKGEPSSGPVSFTVKI
ncbi:hypothetical protein CAPTEDRAFT_212702 [Capitella teleta]|uniref:RRM domain-containing protein n=1 Tax=Capitella teleta TaxID=283909 RepID=R7URV0_CAPTE|nr:hypothetical protein CAPTEDRAFT_212702 [Capitella teleta]|eukprot:ELU06106.1 hypothetical protein CAPTEDRAFT_212702 [Capitella teleta]